MRKLLSGALALAVLLGTYVIAGEVWRRGTPPPITAEGLVRPAPAKGPYPVDRVVDGDTVRVMNNGVSTSVRLVGIDTPETKGPQKPVQCSGAQAAERANELLVPQLRLTLHSIPGLSRQAPARGGTERGAR